VDEPPLIRFCGSWPKGKNKNQPIYTYLYKGVSNILLAFGSLLQHHEPSTIIDSLLKTKALIYKHCHELQFKNPSETILPMCCQIQTRQLLVKETLLALVRDLFTFSSKVIKRFIIV
jgi:hypothetical protein